MYLLDTNALIFYILDSPELPESTKKIITTNECYYSYVSLWEIAIKQGLGKLRLKFSPTDLEGFCIQESFARLPVSVQNFETIRNLPQIHKDPFDRLLIAQAKDNDLTLITSDEIIPKYDVKTLW